MSEQQYNDAGEPITPGINAASMNASMGGMMGPKTGAGRRIEAAIVKVIEDAHAEGITDPDELHDRIETRRQDLKVEMRAEMEAERVKVQDAMNAGLWHEGRIITQDERDRLDAEAESERARAAAAEPEPMSPAEQAERREAYGRGDD